MRYTTVELVGKRQLNRDNFLLLFEDPEIAGAALPGQFLMMAADADAETPFPLLMRPFSFFGTEREQRFSVLVKTVGIGTRKMAAFAPGARVPVIGPIGNQFEVRPGRRPLLIAGGVGIAPFYLLSQRLIADGVRPTLFYGARSRGDLVTLEDFEKLGVEVLAATEDGSLGHKGFVTDALAPFLSGRDDCDLMACGPTPMLAAVAGLAARQECPLQVSVECYMGCGFGACFGCAVETMEGYRLACRSGPVFDGRKLLWKQRSHV